MNLRIHNNDTAFLPNVRAIAESVREHKPYAPSEMTVFFESHKPVTGIWAYVDSNDTVRIYVDKPGTFGEFRFPAHDITYVDCGWYSK
jgi:hypothetical protein